MIIIDATRILFVYFWVSLTVTAMTVARFMLLYYLLNSIRRPSLSKKLTCQNVRCAFHWIQIFWCFCHHERQQHSIYSQQSVDQWDVLFDLQHVCHLKESYLSCCNTLWRNATMKRRTPNGISRCWKRFTDDKSNIFLSNNFPWYFRWHIFPKRVYADDTFVLVFCILPRLCKLWFIS